MNKRVIDMIYKLVGEGVWSIEEIHRALRIFVKLELFEGQSTTPSTRRKEYTKSYI